MTNANRETKNDRRAHAREEARAMREKQKKAEKRRRFLIQGGVGVAIIAVIVIVVLVVVQNQANSVVAAAKAGGPKNMISDGILFHGAGGKAVAVKTAAIKKGGKPVATDSAKYKGKANIVEYIDLQCPFCDEFELTNLTAIEKWVAAGKATVEIHPISILTDPTDGGYSQRAASAVACVANYEPDAFLKALDALYKDQPKEGSGGLANSKIASIISGAGATDPKIRPCINGASFSKWVVAATSRAASGFYAKNATQFSNEVSTPGIAVNGTIYLGDPANSQDWLTNASEFATFVDSIVPGTTS
ncbi:MAG TPA: thioredoxin domain-containing protein [Galbitalea sp.]|nr:thioredoxin domain-containing protein [Galbitalea sp.]